MAKASGLGRTTVQQIWRAFGLQPHRSETFKLSTDPLLVETVRDHAVRTLAGSQVSDDAPCHLRGSHQGLIRIHGR
jgi:hypothetical protein